ncbi:MAG: phosphopantothenoylcysteine decarboxylase [Planctomycetota bacterium]
MPGKILITSGPTRQYLDPVRYLSNGSSGQMGQRLAQSALDHGFDVVVVSGPVTVRYPKLCQLVSVVSTDEMLNATIDHFDSCCGMIAAAAPCDYAPAVVAEDKIKKDGQRIQIDLLETPDILAKVGQLKRANQWTVGFALETSDVHERAFQKLKKKKCDLIVINGPSAIDSDHNEIEMMDATGFIVSKFAGTKKAVANAILQQVKKRLLGTGRF